ncbi:ArsR/SmtB family transcription factor [Schleiferilactobacillus harbinensis]|uniref:ArsR/SmtB family transcription factor n=1 Tax=Schleiferilactobacillus harbinensis TaxID=304207 RepID=UPI00345E4912
MADAQFVYSHDLELAMLAQMALSSRFTLPAQVVAKIADIKLTGPTQEIIAALDQFQLVPLLEVIGAGDVAHFRLVKFAETAAKMPPHVLINLFFGGQLARPAKTWPVLAEQLATLGYAVPALVGQYLFDHQRALLADLQTFLNTVASRFTPADFKDADAAAAELQTQLAPRLQQEAPLTLAEDLMGKQFRNRGPYQRYFFVPTFWGPTIRLFGQQQTLFIHVPITQLTTAQIVAMWKALADDTRYAIIRLMDANGPLRAVDLIDHIGFSAPTISHHLDILRHAGLIHIEPVGRAKYYSLNRNRFRQLELVLQRLSESKQ